MKLIGIFYIYIILSHCETGTMKRMYREDLVHSNITIYVDWFGVQLIWKIHIINLVRFYVLYNVYCILRQEYVCGSVNDNHGIFLSLQTIFIPILIGDWLVRSRSKCYRYLKSHSPYTWLGRGKTTHQQLTCAY